jgi:hypothetical protein
VCRSPVTVNAFNAGYAIAGDFREQAFDDAGLGIIGIDEHRKAALAVFAVIF